MKILFLYTKRMLAANKARTAVTFAGIVLSFALLTAVLTGTSSLFHFFSEYMKMRDGDYYGVIYNCDEEDEARLAQSGEVMQICRMGIVGVAEKNFGIEHEVSLSNRVYVAIGSVRELFSSVQAIEQSLVFDQYKSLLVAVLAGLYSYTFARDYNYHNIRNLLVRVSYKDYVTTKVLVNIGGTIASVIIGFLLTSFLTIPVMPLESSADISYNSDAFRTLMTNPSGAVLYLVLLGTNFGLAAAALTTAGMALSVWSQNSYVAIGGSVLLFYFLYSVSLLLPDRVSFEWISSGLQSLPSENPIWVAVYHLGFLLICNVFSGLFFYYAVRKRYQNGDL